MNTLNKAGALPLPVLNALANTAFATSSQVDAVTIAHDAKSETQECVIAALNANQLEASFLKVYAGCKIDNASFEPISIGVEGVPAQVIMIHSEVA
jgi:hypothetical protein